MSSHHEFTPLSCPFLFTVSAVPAAAASACHVFCMVSAALCTTSFAQMTAADARSMTGTDSLDTLGQWRKEAAPEGFWSLLLMVTCSVTTSGHTSAVTLCLTCVPVAGGVDPAGGLSEAVAALHEALVMPAKYGQLLAAAPLRLRTGGVVKEQQRQQQQ